MPTDAPTQPAGNRKATPRKPLVPGARRLSLIAFTAIFLAAFLYLPHSAEDLAPSANGFKVAGDFFSKALQPAFFDQSPNIPPGTDPFWLRSIDGLKRTILYAFIALSLAVPAALILGFFASRAWWPELPEGHPPTLGIRALRAGLGLGFVATRVFIAFLRSIHELLWAIFFLAAIGDSPFAACVALALPFSGTLAKVFSEIIDEVPRDAKFALTASGASSTRAFVAALIPRALPDLLTYTLYRLECAVRSAAILGFIGIETIGLYIHRSFENLYYREVWTEVYFLLIAIIALDSWGAAIRRRLHEPPPQNKRPKGDCSADSDDQIAALYRSRPRSTFLRVSLVLLIAAVVFSWKSAITDPERPLFGGPPLEKRLENLERFAKKLTPKPVRESGDWSDAIPWIKKIWSEKGAEAAAYTLAVSVAAILLAAASTILFLPLASRVLAKPRPFNLAGRAPPAIAKFAWFSIGVVARFIFIAARALPEYIYAFFLLAIFGLTPWALVIALALHNFGILGRLWGEVVENSPTDSARHLASTGARRAQIFYTGIVPGVFGRFLLYLFYRWETCIREAVILGFLSVPTIGYYIVQARAFLQYDTMLALVLIGAGIIVVGDLISDLLRRWLRRV